MSSRPRRCVTSATGLLVAAALVPIANRQEPREPQLPASQVLHRQQSVESLTSAGSPSPQQPQTHPAGCAESMARPAERACNGRDGPCSADFG